MHSAIIPSAWEGHALGLREYVCSVAVVLLRFSLVDEYMRSLDRPHWQLSTRLRAVVWRSIRKLSADRKYLAAIVSNKIIKRKSDDHAAALQLTVYQRA